MTDFKPTTHEWREGPPPADGNFYVAIDHLNNIDVVVSRDGRVLTIERTGEPWAAYSAPETLSHLWPCLPGLRNLQVKLDKQPTEVTP